VHPADPVAGAGDFDFLIGEWSVRHRRLKRRLAGETEWIEFTGPASVRKILDGLGNIDECRIDLPEGSYRGATLRLFDPATRAWTIYWIDGRNPKLDPPMVGRFEAGRGIFFGDDNLRRQADPRALHLDAGDRRGLSLGTGVLAGRRPDLGDELDDEIHAGRTVKAI
jgi:hypothetical protein